MSTALISHLGRLSRSKLTGFLSKCIADDFLGIHETLEAYKKELSQEQNPELCQIYREEIHETLRKIDLLDIPGDLLSRMPKDPLYSRDAILEVRPGVGGEEAQKFSQELLEMYLEHARLQGWAISHISDISYELGRARSRQSPFYMLRYEKGTHRVQRHSKDRLHTSTASVVVMAKADPVDIKVLDSEFRFQAKKSSGPGGQSVNASHSVCMATHVPSGKVCTVSDSQSYVQNRDRAVQLIRSQLLLQEREAIEEKYARDRESAGTVDRSSKIRTFNYQHDLITDHRLNESFSGALLGLETGSHLNHFRELWTTQEEEAYLRDVEKELAMLVGVS